MSERVSPGAAGQRLGVSGSDIRRAGYTKVTAGGSKRGKTSRRHGSARPGSANQPGPRRAGVSCWVCGTVREVRPSLVEDYTHLVCGSCSGSGKRPEFPSRPGMIVVRTFNVAGYFDGYVHRIATAGERASVDRAAGLARAAFLNAPGEPES